MIIGIIITAIACFAFSSHVVLWKDFKYYKSEYDKLPTYQFYQFWDQIYTNRDMHSDFIWFIKEGEARLKTNVYVWSDLYVWLCPYAAYWLIKYRRWMKNNCKPEIIYKP